MFSRMRKKDSLVFGFRLVLRCSSGKHSCFRASFHFLFPWQGIPFVMFDPVNWRMFRTICSHSCIHVSHLVSIGFLWFPRLIWENRKACHVVLPRAYAIFVVISKNSRIKCSLYPTHVFRL